MMMQMTLPIEEQPEGACRLYEECGNVAPRIRAGRTGEVVGYLTMCDECLDRVRHAGHGRGNES